MSTQFAVRARSRRRLAGLAGLLQFRQGMDDLRRNGTGPWGPAGDAGARDSLHAVGHGLQVSRVIVTTVDDGDALDVRCAPPTRSDMGAADGPSVARALDGHVVRDPGVLALPMRAADRVLGVLTLVARGRRRSWSRDQIAGGLELADVLAQARLQFEERRSLLETADLSRAVLASVGGDVAVIDASGVVIAVNDAWRASIGSTNPIVKGAPGTRLVDTVTLPADARGRLDAALGAVLRREQAPAVLEFAWGDGVGRHWCEVRIQPLHRRAGGAVLTHQDVTPRRRVECDAQRHLHELAHGTVVSGMGELAAAVAHELNQPLTAVLSNAQAARRMLMGPSPRLADVQQILDDIIEQDKRAGDVIQRIRRVLKKEQFEWAPVDVNALVRDVVRLLGNQAALGGVALTPTLNPGLPPVRGDRIQLLQVVLNLLLNALQAASANTSARRPWVALITQAGAGLLRLRVVDSGDGIPAASLGRIFEPFYTTKADGFGVGLSISRSIVELHGGQLTASNHADGGAEFSVTLPAEGACS